MVFDIDREAANREGISTEQVGGALRTAIYGVEVSKFRDAKEDYEINVRSQENQRNNLSAIRNMRVTYRDMGMGRYYSSSSIVIICSNRLRKYLRWY